MVATFDEVAGKSFDYVIVGGGTCGLTLAARIIEGTKKTVAVLEAGSEKLNDPLINLPGQWGVHFGNPAYDWFQSTVPQEALKGRSVFLPGGKALGGSSAINFSLWTKPTSKVVDDWERLGNPGWNWKRFLEASKRSESFTPPADIDEHELLKQSYNANACGKEGPVHTTFPKFVNKGEKKLIDALRNLGVQTAKDPLGGDSVGIAAAAQSAITNSNIQARSYAANAFYLPNEDKPAFNVLCDAPVLRIVTTQGDHKLRKATGVEFEYKSKTATVHAREEVIVCAGALKSPQILELSGIGDKRVLQPLGIETKVDLPGVGANLQDHPLMIMRYVMDPAEFRSFDELGVTEIAAEEKKKYDENQPSSLLTLYPLAVTYLPLLSIASTPLHFKSLVDAQRLKLEEKSKSGDLTKGTVDQLRIQLETIEDGAGADGEIILIPTSLEPEVMIPGSLDDRPSRIGASLVCYLQRPFSRGTIHIKSTIPHDQPAIDLGYLKDEFDLQAMTELVKFASKLTVTEPFRSAILKDRNPDLQGKTDEEVAEFIKETMLSGLHIIGTLSMLPREDNGVVDTSLRVYGTANIRVVDLSIIPLQITAHTQATAYAIAEIAADIIKTEARLST